MTTLGVIGRDGKPNERARPKSAKNRQLCSKRQLPNERGVPWNDVSNAERILTNFKDALGIKKQVGKLQVAVDNKMIVAILNALQQLEHQAFD